jgi:hypothetical protein
VRLSKQVPPLMQAGVQIANELEVKKFDRVLFFALYIRLEQVEPLYPEEQLQKLGAIHTP